jgi:hypothetical protein
MSLKQTSPFRFSRPDNVAGKPFDFRRGGRWILTVLFCLGLLAPSVPVLAGGPGLGNVTGTRATSVTAAPIVDTNNDLNLPINTTATINASFLHASETGVAPSALVFTILTKVSQGALKMNGAGLGLGATFTQQDINSGLLTYSASGAVSQTGFTFRVSHGLEVSSILVFTIHINKPEPTTYPTGFKAVADSISQITTTWTDVPGVTAPDGYVVLCSPFGSPNPPADTTTPINNTCTDGSGSIHVPQGVQKATWTGLNSETTYYFAIYPYAQTDYTLTPGAFFDYLTGPGTPTANARTFLTYSISGTVTDASLAPINGALIDAGGGHTALSDENGAYILPGLTPGDYTLTISWPCYSFMPPSLLVTVSDMNNHVTGQSFTGLALPCIRGTVTDGANPLSGALITDGASLSAHSDANGAYFIPVPTNYSGTLAPILLDYYFIPDRRSYTNVNSIQNNQGYTGTKIATSWNRFMAAWGSVPNATGYFLDVANDAGFTSFVPGYQNKDVGNVVQFDVTGLAPHTHYFFRVRAHDASQTFGNSIPTEVLTDWAAFFPIVRH